MLFFPLQAFYYFLLVPSTADATPATKGVRRRGTPLQDIR